MRAEPLGLPVPAAWLLALKLFGFIVHMVFMNLWLAGMPTALLLRNSQPLIASRLFRAMPFFMAFGINAGIVPLLFLQTLYPQFFYPATILQGWFWFLVIPLLIVAYYAVYLAAFDKYRALAATVASILLAWIGLTFSSAMSLTAAPETAAALFTTQADAGSVPGSMLHLGGEAWLRFLVMAGLACGTLAAYLALDGEFMTRQAECRAAARRLVAPLYLVGLAIFALAALFYAPTVRGRLPEFLWMASGAAIPVGAIVAALYFMRPARALAAVLVAVHGLALVFNALARQSVQGRALERWARLDQIPVRGDWDSFVLFVVVLLIVLACMGWLLRVVRRAAHSAV